jgi:hypothetical protein
MLQASPVNSSSFKNKLKGVQLTYRTPAADLSQETQEIVMTWNEQKTEEMVFSYLWHNKRLLISIYTRRRDSGKSLAPTDEFYQYERKASDLTESTLETNRTGFITFTQLSHPYVVNQVRHEIAALDIEFQCEACWQQCVHTIQRGRILY